MSKEKLRIPIPSKVRNLFLTESEKHKRPSDLEISQKGLPRNTPTLIERVKRDEHSPVFVRDRHSGYHKGLTGTWQDYVDPNATAMDIVKDSFRGIKTEVTKFAKECTSGEAFSMAIKDLPKPDEERLVFDFDTPQKINDWIVTCDSTWGEGYSTATLTESPLAKGKAMFSGVLDTKPPNDGRIQRAGYANMRSVYKMKSFGRVIDLDWHDFTHLVLRVRGDGRTYVCNLYYYDDYDVQWNDIMQFPLYTRGGPYWQTTVIPFSHFFLTYCGRIQDNLEVLRVDDVVAVGFTLMDRVDGPFQLELDSIKVRCVKNSTSCRDFPYETYKFPKQNYNRP